MGVGIMILTPVTVLVRAGVNEDAPLMLFIPVPLATPLAVNAAVRVPVTVAPILLKEILVTEASALAVRELE